MGNQSLNNFIDTQMLQQIQHHFYNATGISIYTVDLQQEITSETGRTEIYNDFIKKTDVGLGKWKSCQNSLREQSINSGRCAFSSCFCGMIEAAVPFVLNGKGMGAMMIGPVFAEKPDENLLRKTAKELKIDENRFLNAASRITIIPRVQFEATADFLSTMINMYIDMGKKCFITNEKSEKLIANAEIMNKSLLNAEGLLNSNGEIVKALTKDFDQLNKLSDSATQQLENTSETVKIIQNIAMNTRILGFNASIEASRAKESGKGFGVIAQEVRSLADVSKTSAEKIEEIIGNISDITQEIRATILETSEAVKSSFDSMNNMVTLLNSMREVTAKID